MSNNSNAIQILQDAQEKLTRKYREEMAVLSDSIARLTDSSGTKAEPPAVKPGQFKDVKPAVAIQQYLISRGGGPVPTSQIISALKAGGLAPLEWKSKKRTFEHNVKITIGNNNKIFNLDETWDTVELKWENQSNIA